MKIFRELTFEGKSDDLERFLDDIDSVLSDGWYRDHEMEEKRLLENYYVGITTYDRVYCCANSRHRLECHLWLIARSEGTLFVSNIVPIEIAQLNYDEYNAVLEEFFNRFASKAASRHRVNACLGLDNWSPETHLPDQVSRSLRNFCGTARRYSGLGHPADEERWQQFIITAHDANCKLNGTTLHRWLLEDEHWPDVFVDQMVEEYLKGRSLLARAHRASA